MNFSKSWMAIAVTLLISSASACEFADPAVCTSCQSNPTNCASTIVTYCNSVSWNEDACMTVGVECPFKTTAALGTASPCESSVCTGSSAELNETLCINQIDMYCQSEFYLSTLSPSGFTADTACNTVVTSTPSPVEILMMDSEDGMEMPGWGTGTSSQHQGSNYFWTTSKSVSATFTTNIAASGNYEVAVTYGGGSSRSNAVPYTVAHAMGSDTVMVDQTDNDGNFVSIGEYHFTAGMDALVTIDTAGTTGTVTVDSVRFTHIAPTLPTIMIDTETSPSEVTFNGWFGTGSSTGTFQGSSYHWATSSTTTMTYTPTFPYSGDYEVLVSFSGAASRGTDVPHTIVHAGGSTTVDVDQTLVKDFYYIGSYSFMAGTSGSVTVAAPSSGSWSVDSIKFVPVTPGVTTFKIDTEEGAPRALVDQYWQSATSTSITYRGENFLYSSNPTQTVKYVPEFEVDGMYDVYVTFGGHAARGTNVPHTVYHAGGTTVVPVDQTDRSARYVYVGTFHFSPNSDHQIHVNPAGDGKVASADSIYIELSQNDNTIDTEDGNVPLVHMATSSSTNVYNHGETYNYASSQWGRATFTPSINITGEYSVLTIWGGGGSRSSGVPHMIKSANAETVTYIDQTDNLPYYEEVGVVTLSPSSSASMALYKDTNFPGVISADAVRFVYLDSLFVQDLIYLDSEWYETDPSVFKRGHWGSSSSLKHQGANYLYVPDNLYSQIRFQPTFFNTGTYEVSVTFGGFASRSAVAPYVIKHAGGEQTVLLSQQVNDDVFYSLGTFTFNKGTSGYVMLKADGAGALVSADAIKFTLVQ